MDLNFYLAFFEDEFSDDSFEHNLFGHGQFLCGLTRRSGDSVSDDGHNHEDVAQPE